MVVEEQHIKSERRTRALQKIIISAKILCTKTKKKKPSKKKKGKHAYQLLKSTGLKVLYGGRFTNIQFDPKFIGSVKRLLYNAPMYTENRRTGIKKMVYLPPYTISIISLNFLPPRNEAARRSMRPWPTSPDITPNLKVMTVKTARLTLELTMFWKPRVN